MLKIAKKILNVILDVIFPKKCFGCGKKDIVLCDDCLKKLPWPEEEKPGIKAAVSYRSPIMKKMIRALKYRRAKIVAEPLAKLIISRIREVRPPEGGRTSYALIPVPLSKKRLKKRGFNQAELIAKHLSDKLSIKMFNNVLYKIRDTASQVEIKDKEKRLSNLTGAFTLKNPELIKNKTIFLVDDVSTTGATINEAAKTLKNAGAKKIIGIVAASG